MPVNLGLVTVEVPQWGFWPGVITAIVITGIVGIVIEYGLLKRVYERDHLDQLLLTFALVLILTDAIRFIFGSQSHIIDPPSLVAGSLALPGGFAIPMYRAFMVLASIVVMGAIFVTLRTTNIGRLVRATSSDRDMSRLLGVNVSRLYTIVFFAGVALTAIGGALAAPLLSVTPELGNQVIINAFVVVVIGGLGSFFGAFVGAYIIGLMIAVGSIVVPGAGELFPFIAMIVVLLWKPEGLFGGIEA
jgi:branched-chain amino acid transport system permease protein